jgi:hypothetical protein
MKQKIEPILPDSLPSRAKAALYLRDLKRINRAADRLNAEASQVLRFQDSGR